LKEECKFDEDAENEHSLKSLNYTVSKDNLRAAGKNLGEEIDCNVDNIVECWSSIHKDKP